MASQDHDKLLREMAQHRGFKLVKSRRRKPGAGDYGHYGLADANTGKHCFGFGAKGLEATPDQVESFLRGKAQADWRSSLANPGPPPAARKRAPKERAKPLKESRAKPARERPPSPKPAARTAPKPEPKPKPKQKPLKVRRARPGDAGPIAALIETMDGAAQRAAIAKAVRALLREGAPPLVAEEGGIVGCAAWQLIRAPQHGAPIGRITLLFTARNERRRGIGTALLESVEAELLRRGCEIIELVHNIELSNANSFLRRHGYHRDGYRFARRQSADQRK
jgi:GNAT superfamily N-acetyltransferase